MNYAQFEDKYKLTLDAQQQTAVCAADGPVLLLAVPGSGKTTVLLARLAYLLCNGLAPGNVLVMTYTVAATAELRSRFAAIYGDLAAGVEFRTINGVCARILRRYAQLTGAAVFELIADEAKLSALVGEIYRRQTEDFATEGDLRALRTQIAYIKNQMLKEEEIDDLTLEGGAKTAPIYREYCKILRANRWMDYDDQLVYARQVLRRYPAILQSLRRRYTHLCVDEAQDTSKIQHDIIHLLAGQGQGLFMVGDEDQSIYGFRAACPGALLRFEQIYPGARVLLLERNYRSTPQIVATAADFIRHNTARRDKHMTAAAPPGVPVRRILCRDRREQYALLADLAAQCADAPQTETTAVLYRDNDSALPLIDQLQRRGLPYRARQVEGSFFTSRIVRDVADFIHLAANPADTEAFLRIYYKLGLPIPKLAAQAAAAQTAARGGNVLAVLRAQPLSTWAVTGLQAMQTHLRLLPQDSAARALERIVLEMGYGEYLEQRALNRSKLDILQALAADIPTPAELLARLQALRAIVRDGAGQGGGRGLTLSTIHSSKGLEYDRVLLADVVDGILPSAPLPLAAPTPEQLEAYEEERRIFYVGITRAKRELGLFCFRRFDQHSAFADTLFPPDPPPCPRTPVRTNAAMPQFTLPTGTVPRANPKLQALAKEFFAGAAVHHRSYGAGTVIQKEQDRITVAFAGGETRSFSLLAALQAGALRLN